MSKTVKIQTIYQSNGLEPYETHQSNNGSIRSSGKIRKRIILGEKFDYGEKAKEKENYVYYIAGQGQEKTEIEEMEQITGQPKKNEKIVKEVQIIDNYQYHETKDIKNKNSKNTETRHQRLCSPFERTKIKKYSSYTSEQKKSGYKIIKTTDLVNKNNYSRTNLFKNKFKHINYQSKNAASTKNVTDNPKPYETYKPIKKITNQNTNVSSQAISKTQRPASYGLKNSTINNYERKIQFNGHKSNDNIRINSNKPKKIFIPQKIVNYEFSERPTNSQISHGYIPYSKREASIVRREYSSQYNPEKPKIEIPVPVNRIKIDSQSRPEKKLDEGPKIQLVGEGRPISRVHSRSRPSSRPRQTKNDNTKKGYIPFSGHGTRVGQGSLNAQIPKPIPRPNIYKSEEEFSQKMDRNTSFSNLSQTSHTSNKSIIASSQANDNLTKKVKKFSYYENYKKVKNNSIKFPGNGMKVGGNSVIKRKIGLNSDFNSGISYSEYTKYSQKSNQVEQKVTNENISENIRNTNESNGNFKEVFCPVHGRRIITLNNANN